MEITPRLLPGSPIAELDFLNARERKALAAADFHTAGDLLRTAPRRYEDRRNAGQPLSSLANGESVCLQLVIHRATWRYTYTRFYELDAGTPGEPNGARILLRWYNMPYISKLLAVGMRLSVYGKVRVVSGKWVMSKSPR